MRKESWYSYLRWPSNEKEEFPFKIINKNNEVLLYTKEEEKKYNTALKKHLNKLKEEENA